MIPAGRRGGQTDCRRLRRHASTPCQHPNDHVDRPVPSRRKCAVSVAIDENGFDRPARRADGDATPRLADRPCDLPTFPLASLPGAAGLALAGITGIGPALARLSTMGFPRPSFRFQTCRAMLSRFGGPALPGIARNRAETTLRPNGFKRARSGVGRSLHAVVRPDADVIRQDLVRGSLREDTDGTAVSHHGQISRVRDVVYELVP